jgi:hypothetical protein
MEIKVEVTDQQIKDALDRQARVALGHLFQTKEINKMVSDHVKLLVPKILEESIKEVPQEAIKELFLAKLQDALAVKVKTRLKGL